MKRIVLFLITNLAIMVVLSSAVRISGADRYLTTNGLDLERLLVFAAVIGFGGAFLSLLLSKPIAKWSTGAKVIIQPKGQTEAWLLSTVGTLAERAKIPLPEVAIYPGPPNAFATGATRNRSLVAVSTGLLQGMPPEEVAAVLAHEVAHIANGDRVTLTLIQGVVNTFVVFISRLIAYGVDIFLRRDDRGNQGMSLWYGVTHVVCELFFGILASILVAKFSRDREFRADAGAAKILGSRNRS